VIFLSAAAKAEWVGDAAAIDAIYLKAQRSAQVGEGATAGGAVSFSLPQQNAPSGLRVPLRRTGGR
jgi:hypothetical protein